MGIPAYFKSITRKYGDIINHKKPRCSRLFLDLNCAIHTCANSVLQQQRLTTEQIEHEIIQHTINYIHELISYSQPEELVYIAIDGIPPRSKISQQQKRRYVSSWKNEIINAKKRQLKIEYADWDTNAITPGTAFMNKLSLNLHKHFEQNKTMNHEIILSDSNEKGEGEAKILDHIKTTPTPEYNDIIYGLDADLIMLSLLSHKNNIHLLREPVHYDQRVQHQNPHPFLFLNITLLKKYIAYDILKTNYEKSSEHVINNIVWDYVVLCFMQGNDFIPPLSYLKIRNNGIDLILEIYKNHINKNKETNEIPQTAFIVNYSVNPSSEHARTNFRLNYNNISLILEQLKNIEDEAMLEAEKKYYSNEVYNHTPNNAYHTHFNKKTVIDKLVRELDNFPTLNKYPLRIQPQRQGWRLRYYHELFDIDDISDVDKVCLNYIEGIEWTFNYYFNENISNDWFYQFTYSPTILDICNYMTLYDANVALTYSQSNISSNIPLYKYVQTSIRDKYNTISYDTDLQLLMCLPPSSYSLLKPCLQRVMTDIDIGCVHMYPLRFKLTTYLKTFLWEAYPILPKIDVKKLFHIKNELVNL
jgi:5'-3' exonuclease